MAVRLRIGQIDLAIQLFAERAPVEFDERMLLGDFADDGIGDAGAFAETSEMELPHFTAAAHIVHQVIGISFAANESHLPFRNKIRSCLWSVAPYV